MENNNNNAKLKENYKRLILMLTKVHTIFENKNGNIDEIEFKTIQNTNKEIDKIKKIIDLRISKLNDLEIKEFSKLIIISETLIEQTSNYYEIYLIKTQNKK